MYELTSVLVCVHSLYTSLIVVGSVSVGTRGLSSVGNFHGISCVLAFSISLCCVCLPILHFYSVVANILFFVSNWYQSTEIWKIHLRVCNRLQLFSVEVEDERYVSVQRFVAADTVQKDKA